MPNEDVAMHVSRIVSRRGEKEYYSYLVRRSFRENGKVKHETVANISKLPLAAIEAISLALSKKAVVEAGSEFEITKSLKHGSVAFLSELAKSSGLIDCLGPSSKERDLILALIIAQSLKPSSKLAHVNYLSSTTLVDDLDLGELDSDRLYEALDYLLGQQSAIEQKLVKSHIGEGSMLLYDLSSSYMEGSKCPLSRYGYSRDKKRGKLQIEYGVLAAKEGLPLAVKVFPGNTSDLSSFSSVVEDLKTTHNLTKIIIVGDRGMFSSANIDKLQQVDPSYLYISALRSSQIRSLVEQGAIQLGLFDELDLLEISVHPDYPGERLVVCKNEELGRKRSHDRNALIEVATTRLDKLKVSVENGRIKDPGAIGRKVEAALSSTKMSKHIKVNVATQYFDYELDQDSITKEAALDGIYVIRTTVDHKELNSAEVVEAYKNLANVERAFRSLKAIDINVRPVRHYLEDRVRAHVFLCTLSAHLMHFARQKLAPLTFRDTEPPTNTSPVAKKQVSASAKDKAARKVNNNGDEVLSLRALFDNLDTLTRNVCRIKDTQVTFTKTTIPTQLQRQAFELIGAKIPR